MSDQAAGLSMAALPFLIVLLVRSATFRVLTIVVGGLFVLGSSTDVGVTKVLYSAIVAACGAVSLYRLLKDPPAYVQHFRPALGWGLALLAILALGLLASPEGVDFVTFGRQAIYYVLLVIAPIVGLDAGRELRPATVYRVILVIGVLAAAGFMIDWLNRRGVTALNIDRIVVSSFFLPALAFSLAVLLALSAKAFRDKLLAVGAAISIPIMLAVTGTRSSILLLLAVVFSIGKVGKSRIPPLRVLVLLAVVAIPAAAMAAFISANVIADRDFLVLRFGALQNLLIGEPVADLSFALRSQQYEQALALIELSPLLGYGLGYSIPFTLDTPLLTVVRLGLLGTLIVIGLLFTLATGVHRASREYGFNPASTIFWTFIGIAVIYLPLGTPLEDRGFAFALVLALMAVGSELDVSHRRRASAAPTEHLPQISAT
ncbi:O-antigen ligase family protein [Microcella alkalica]|uniref:O-antigen ligase family protein n=1 Tax=Microcella alkalica TaxID=355930 RepID=UPI00145EF946|nr:O-antigen ligase family protein [Microcella alkalica]